MSVKAPYYPNIFYNEKKTLFGMIETDHPQLYEKKVISSTGTIIYSARLDMLVALEDLWGENILMARSHTYKIISGNCSDEEFRSILISYVKRYSAFQNYVLSKYLFESDDNNLVRAIIVPAIQEINKYKNYLLRVVENNSCRVVMETNGYLYITSRKPIVLNLRGMKVIN